MAIYEGMQTGNEGHLPGYEGILAGNDDLLPDSQRFSSGIHHFLFDLCRSRVDLCKFLIHSRENDQDLHQNVYTATIFAREVCTFSQEVYSFDQEVVFSLQTTTLCLSGSIFK